ncbi:uncharacterized protein EKO05_0003924 [Ascochyta rabiei]|uniref:Uncharacterized protein n=1 Tax=Didymella rabiei TaxID=5454 RepID=A0A163ME95_DIDRA|nr:uncharacterized protein EKO05_0003924 [Ascochyta rabiei]KZM28637.1 hypothetical protein ST47_g221 [Ascochyta rabiei]UPX13416.1 hypothetical protein EKO05_0003924 [Ascochyta rabiei]
MLSSNCLAALTTLVVLTTSAPTPIAASSSGLATVDLRIIGPQSTHYSTNNQSPTSDQSQHLTVIVGQALSLEHDPLHVQGLQIAAVEAGESLSLSSTSVVDNGWRVVCTAHIVGKDDLVEFDMRDKGVLLAGGGLAKVTRLSCVVDEEA